MSARQRMKGITELLKMVSARSVTQSNPLHDYIRGYSNPNSQYEDIWAANQTTKEIRKTTKDLLIAAAGRNDLAKVKNFLELGVDINAKDRNGLTPLTNAIRSRHEGMARFLMGNGAEKPKDSLIEAARCSLDFIRYLLLNEANVNERSKWELRTPLHQAANHNNVPLLALLLEHGADLDAKDKNGNTPLYWAIKSNAVDAVHFLLSKGADASAINNAGESIAHHSAVAHYVSLKPNSDIANMISMFGNIYKKNKEGKSALDIAYDDNTRVALLTGFDVYMQSMLNAFKDTSGDYLLCFDLVKIILDYAMGMHLPVNMTVEFYEKLQGLFSEDNYDDVPSTSSAKVITYVHN